MINGEVYTGRDGYAGEVSINNFKEEDLFNCDFSNPCFLKRWEMDLGIVDEVKGLLQADKEAASKFYQLTSSTLQNVDLKSVFIAARSHDPLAVEALRKAAKRLGIKIAYLVNLFNPEAVVIGGGLEEAGDVFLNDVSMSVKEWAFRRRRKI